MHRIRDSVLAVAAAALTLTCVTTGCSGKGAQAESQAQTQARRPISYIDSWGVKGDGPGQMEQPIAIATDVLGNVYLPDAGNHFIDKFNWEGRPLFAYEEEMLKNPQSITVDSGGAIYVTDSGRSSVLVFLPNGDRYHEIKLKSRANSENTIGVAVGEDGLIHVLDPIAESVATYTAAFRMIRAWQPVASGPNARVRGTSIAVGPDGYLYILDPAGNRIVRFTEDGHCVSEISAIAGGAARRLSDEFAVAGGYIFAMDADGRMLHVWSVEGKAKLDLDLATELGQGNRPAPALAVSSRKELLVLDSSGSRVLRYQINF